MGVWMPTDRAEQARRARRAISPWMEPYLTDDCAIHLFEGKRRHVARWWRYRKLCAAMPWVRAVFGPAKRY